MMWNCELLFIMNRIEKLEKVNLLGSQNYIELDKQIKKVL